MKFAWVGVALAVVAAAAGVFLTYAVQAARYATEAEHNLHAGSTAIRAVEVFLDKERRWPRSERELIERARYAGGIYSWPDDRAEVLQRVEIRYDVTLERVAVDEDYAAPPVPPLRICRALRI